MTVSRDEMIKAAMSRVKGDVAMPENLPEDQGKPGPNHGVKDPPLSDTDFYHGFWGPNRGEVYGNDGTHDGPSFEHGLWGPQGRDGNGAGPISQNLQDFIDGQSYHPGGAAVDYAGPASEQMTRFLANMRLNKPNSNAENDGLPENPGNIYATHLFRRKEKDRQERVRGKHHGHKRNNIHTDQPEALKMALDVMGIHSDRNPGGMPIEIADAKTLFFGDREVDALQEAEWRTKIEQGDSKIDIRKCRKFVNYDGSMTWEILNEDKTVMSRFTMGEFKGKKIFAQGGYSKFAELLKDVQSKAGKDDGAEFDAIREGSV